jgi:subfamily B ATP-binding cassette protein MsbA
MILTRTATTLVLPASSKVLIDEVVVAGRHTLLAPLTFVVCVAALLQASLGLSIDYLLSRSSTLLVAGFRIRLVEHLLRLPIGYFDSQRDGSIASRVMNDADAVRHFAGSGAAECAGGIVTALAVLVMLCTLSLRLTALIFAVCIVFATAVWICARKAKPSYIKRINSCAEVNAQLLARLIHEGAMSGGGRGEIGPKMLVAG